MASKQTYRVVTTKKQEGSLAATSHVSDEMWKHDAINSLYRIFREDASVVEVTIKKTNSQSNNE